MKPAQLLSPREQFQCYITGFKNQLNEIEDMVNIMEENEELLFQIGQVENVLVKSQIALSSLFQEVRAQNLNVITTDISPQCKILKNGGIKLTVPLHPPKTYIINRLELNKYGKFGTEAYQSARNMWFSLISEAVKEHKGLQVSPSFIVIQFHTTHKLNRIDADNYTIKFIIDGLKENGLIGPDDNASFVRCYSVNVIHNSTSFTEIYILPYQNQIEEIVSEYETF